MQASIKFDAQDMADVKKLLNSHDELYNKVAFRAMKKVVKGVKTDTDAEIRGVYNLKKSDVFKGIYTTVGTQDAPAFSVTVGKHGDNTSQPIPLINFSATMTKKGASVKVLKAGGKRAIPHTFIGAGKNNNTHVFGRSWHWTKRGAPISRPSVAFKPGFPYSGLPLKFRQPVYKKSGPRLADAFISRYASYENVKRKGVERIKKEVGYQMDMAFNRLR